MLIKIYPENPNPREIDKVIDVLRDGGLVITRPTQYMRSAVMH